MIIKTIAVTYERKINTGNYSSATLACTLSADIAPDESPVISIGALQELARNSVRSEYLRLVSKTEGQQP